MIVFVSFSLSFRFRCAFVSCSFRVRFVFGSFCFRFVFVSVSFRFRFVFGSCSFRVRFVFVSFSFRCVFVSSSFRFRFVYEKQGILEWRMKHGETKQEHEQLSEMVSSVRRRTEKAGVGSPPAKKRRLWFWQGA